MSFDARNNSALSKRAEQLKRWEESDTNLEPTSPKNLSGRRIKFSSGCVFLAACMSGDREEVLRLLETGADIDTANVDGLTALHQACIDDNLEMVEFLVHAGADVNRQDNEGWTPLHATASCGFVSIARYLIENGANLSAVSSDGELAIDLAESDHMEALLQEHIVAQRIDCVEARKSEEKIMLNDAKNWLRSDASEADKPHPRTGATALHVAAAKGYCKVLSLLLATRADVDKQDNDGWTPMHAAAHWGQEDAAKMLVAALADMDVKNFAGQTPLDVADPNIHRFLEDLKKNTKRAKRRPASQIRISDNMDNHIEPPTRVIRVEVKPDADDDKSKLSATTESSITQPSKDVNSVTDDDAPWRRSGSLRNRIQQESPPKIQVPDKDLSQTPESEVILRRTQSFENDDKKSALPPIAASPTAQTTLSGTVTPTPPPPTTATTTTTTPSGQIRRSFVPPVRDEESETQRKAHAKRVRETRRSTQGVTLDEIKSAEELVKKINLNNNNNNNSNNNNNNTNANNNNNSSEVSTINTTPTATTTTTSASPSSTQINTTNTTTTTTTTVIPTQCNDKVPVLKAGPNQLQTDNPCSSSALKSNDPIVTASYTISAPSSSSSSSATHKQDTTNDKLTASYTMPPPSSSSSSIVPSSQLPSAAHSKSTTVTNALNKSSNNSRRNSSTEPTSPTISATINVSASTPTTSKTDLETLTKTALPTVAHATIKLDKSGPAAVSSATTTAAAAAAAAATNDDDDENSRTVNATVVPISADPTVNFTFSSGKTRDKRSLFDIDNASSLSLADKLRNEANKYSEASRSNSDVSSVGLHGNKNAALEADTDRKYGSTPSSPMHHTSTAASASSASSSSSSGGNTAERRPSWRLKFDAGCKFKLEDAAQVTVANNNNNNNSLSNNAISSSSYLPNTQKRNSTNLVQSNNNNNINNSQQRPVSAPVIAASNLETTTTTSSSSSTTTTTPSVNDRIKENSADVTLSLRRSKPNSEDKENDKENDSRSAQATQAVIQRRRRPKRRSTGVVHVDMDDIDPDRQDVDGDDKESGSEKATRSRLGSTSSLASEQDNKTGAADNSTVNGELIDYKALYEAARLDNDKLRIQLKKKDEDLLNAKATVDRFANATTKNSLSELEKRERRALERKLSEMEEELKNYDVLKTENQRLKDENGALIRVISKLSK